MRAAALGAPDVPLIEVWAIFECTVWGVCDEEAAAWQNVQWFVEMWLNVAEFRPQKLFWYEGKGQTGKGRRVFHPAITGMQTTSTDP